MRGLARLAVPSGTERPRGPCRARAGRRSPGRIPTGRIATLPRLNRITLDDSERATIAARPAPDHATDAVEASSADETPRAARGRASAARPFLKWAGGKTQLLEPLIARAPREIETYHEPFLGGGAMFFGLLANPELAPKRAVLNDLNRDLVTVYETVRDEVDALIEALGRLSEVYLEASEDQRSEIYYGERERRPEDRVDLAARFIFLNKTCFNGLYRVNRRGEFNVPHGKYRSPRILDEQGLRDASVALSETELTCLDFEEALRAPRAGDFVYLDPPFEPLSKTSSFTGYTQGAFGRPEQQRLKWAVDDLTARGVRVMLSNSSQDYILGLYTADRGPFTDPPKRGHAPSGGTRYRFETTLARRAINSRGDRRGAIDELIVLNYPRDGERRALESARQPRG